jgi:hypothetical protein
MSLETLDGEAAAHCFRPLGFAADAFEWRSAFTLHAGANAGGDSEAELEEPGDLLSVWDVRRQQESKQPRQEYGLSCLVAGGIADPEQTAGAKRLVDLRYQARSLDQVMKDPIGDR